MRRSFSGESTEVAVLQSLTDALGRATIGEYEIREELGRGGMAYVFLAHEISLGRKVALKVLAPHLHLVPGMSTRFLREAQTAAGLEHPNIIPIYARRETADVVFFTMRYVAGIPLSTLARQVGQLPVPLVLSLLADIGGALAFAHQHHVLHRDVKPGNVMLGRDGSVFVTDFGIAKQAEGDALTVTGQLLGTPGYMSPEQCRGRDISPASDQYSLGAMAFELLTGRAPFVGSNAMDIMAQHLTERPPSVLDFRPDCPGELAQAVARTLAKESTARFASIEQLLWSVRAAPLALGDPLRAQLAEWVTNPLHARVFSVTPVSPTPRLSDFVPAQPTVPRAESAQQLQQSAAWIGTAVVPPRAPTPEPTPTPVTRPSTSSGQPSVVNPNRRTLAGRLGALVVVALVIALWQSDRGGGTRTLPSRTTPESTPAVVKGSGEMNATARRDSATQGESDIDRRERAESTVAPVAITGVLVLRRVPDGATILLDGERVRGTRFSLATGRHTVSIDAPGFRPFQVSANVTTGDTRSIAFDAAPLEPAVPTTRSDSASSPRSEPVPVGNGTLRLRVSPFARIFLDGRFLVEDELLVRQLPAGRHVLRFEKDGYDRKDTTLVIANGDTLTLRMTLQRKTQ